MLRGLLKFVELQSNFDNSNHKLVTKKFELSRHVESYKCIFIIWVWFKPDITKDTAKVEEEFRIL